MNIELTTYGQKALGSLTMAGKKPLISKGQFQINLRSLDNTPDNVIRHFLAPNNANPYFRVKAESSASVAQAPKAPSTTK